MTEQEERIQRAEQAIAAIEGLYGVRIVATVERLADGTILFDTMKPRVVALANWQPPQVDTAAPENGSTVTASIDTTALQADTVSVNGASEGRFDE